MKTAVLELFSGFSHTLWEVTLALIPLVAVFLFFQIFFLKLPGSYIINVIKGMGLTFAGLALFLQGVKGAFLPVGTAVGEVLGGLEAKWMLVFIGFVLGFAATIAEPAVRVLNYQIEKASSGYIKKNQMLMTLSIGVSISVALAMVRIIMGWPLIYILLPGYLLAIVLVFISDANFVSIAFDAGGVATGPMTVTFIMALAVGIAASMEGSNPLIDGFGLIALVALAPILAVLTLGLLVKYLNREEV